MFEGLAKMENYGKCPKDFAVFPVSRHCPYSKDFAVFLFLDIFHIQRILLFSLYQDTFRLMLDQAQSEA